MNLNDSDEDLAVSMEEVISNTKIHPKENDDECPLCAEPSLEILINNALYHKYLDTQYINYLKYMDNIIDNENSKEAVVFREMAVSDEEEEFMRRMYSLSEYDYKNKAIVEYYKFHKDYPKLHVKGVSRIMESYADRKKEFEYKKIKRILKEEENISITTQKSSEIFSDIEDEDKKSNYSNVLHDLTQSTFLFNEENNESQVFKFMCKKIDQAFQNQPLSPINFRKKSIFEQGENNEVTQTKNFVNYLKKQQEKREREEKYKNFIRSTKESRYNSIEHENKQYSSGSTSATTLIKTLTKANREKPTAILKGANAFYDGRIFYSSSNKANLGSMSKERTKEQTNLPSQENMEFDYIFAENGFKKQKEPPHINGFHSKNEKPEIDKHFENFATERQTSQQIELTGLKNKQTTKTTEFIYKNATQDMRLKKRSVSYNSLAHNNHISKRPSGINPLKEKDFEIRNRIFSQREKILKDKNEFITNQATLVVNNQGRINKSRSSCNIKTSRSVPKFYQADNIIESTNKKNEYSSSKKVSIPKDLIKALKGKSYSTSKLKSDPESSSRSGNYLEKEAIKESKKDMNLFIENGVKNKIEPNNLIYTHHATKNVDIDRLLNKKLFVKQDPQKNRQHKILI